MHEFNYRMVETLEKLMYYAGGFQKEDNLCLNSQDPNLRHLNQDQDFQVLETKTMSSRTTSLLYSSWDRLFFSFKLWLVSH